jgi:hypothetical protein
MMIDLFGYVTGKGIRMARFFGQKYRRNHPAEV